MRELVYQAIKERRLPCLSLMKDILKVLIFLYLPVAFELVAGSSNLARNRSPGF